MEIKLTTSVYYVFATTQNYRIMNGDLMEGELVYYSPENSMVENEQVCSGWHYQGFSPNHHVFNDAYHPFESMDEALKAFAKHLMGS